VNKEWQAKGRYKSTNKAQEAGSSLSLHAFSGEAIVRYTSFLLAILYSPRIPGLVDNENLHEIECF